MGNESVTYSYDYDDNGNILSISDGTSTTSYVYDSANQLIRENNEAGEYTHTWTYDNAGNILQRKEYDYTTGVLDENGGTEVAYEYPTVTDPENNTVWGDKLTSYDGQEIAYDPIGNPLSISNAESGYSRTYTWEHGRQLKSLTEGTTTWNYTYNSGGMRTGRTDGTTTYSYIYSGSQLAQMKVDSNTLNFTYDAAGIPLTVTYNGTKYYYTTNIQGDVVAILDSSGTQVASYTYDAWGNCLTAPTSGVGLHNPLRYRGYVYDRETELYYLQSRYYDPELGRFLNADGYTTTGQGFTGNNMFAYCGNNPVSRADPSGQSFIEWLIELFKRLTSFGKTEYGAAEGAQAYSSADDAARAFSTSIYASSSYSRHEYSTEIYSITSGGKTSYYYTTPAVGSPHSATGIDLGRVPSKGKIVAYAHTHPNSNSFSQPDRDYARDHYINAYVVGPNYELKRYDYISGEETGLGRITPTPLTAAQMNDLNSLVVSWEDHFVGGVCPKGFGCEHKSWPNR